MVIAVIPYKQKEALLIANNKLVKSVAFNRSNLADQQILKFVARRNFSGYVKKLIIADMINRGIEVISKSRKKAE